MKVYLFVICFFLLINLSHISGLGGFLEKFPVFFVPMIYPVIAVSISDTYDGSVEFYDSLHEIVDTCVPRKLKFFDCRVVYLLFHCDVLPK